MGRYDPYALISDMRGGLAGLGAAFVPPAVIPNPSKSEKNAREFMRIWIAWAAAREVTLREWASAIDSLISNKSATCAEIAKYNDAAIAHYVTEVEMGLRFILGGVSQKDLPTPFFPLVFASSTRIEDITGFADWPTGRVTIKYTLPCGTNGVFPDFAAMRVFGDPRDVSGAKTPPGQQQLGFLAALPAWAIVSLAAIVFGGTFLIVNAFRDWTSTQQTREEAKLRDQEAEQNKRRAEFQGNCVERSIAKLEGKMSAADFLRIRAECLEEANKVFPQLTRAPSETTLGTSILLGGLGIAAVVASIAFFKSQKHES